MPVRWRIYSDASNTACWRDGYLLPGDAKKFAATAFDGEGARLYGGRWNSKGTTLVYTASSLSLAILELLVHLESYQILAGRYCYFAVSFPEDCCEMLDPTGMLPNWSGDPPISQTKQQGDTWAKEQRSAVLGVPSAITPGEHNYLINPRHLDFSQLVIGSAQDFVFDPRLVKTTGA